MRLYYRNIKLDKQLCAGQPPRYKQRLEEVPGAGAFVQWELPALQTETVQMHTPRRHTLEENGALF